MYVVYLFYHIATCCQRHYDAAARIVVGGLFRPPAAAVDRVYVAVRGHACAEAVKDVYEVFLMLSVGFPQLYRHQTECLEYAGVEEEGIAVLFLQYALVLRRHHGFELEHVAYKEQLFASEWLAPVAASEGAQYAVDKVNHISPNHRNLIDYDKFYLFEEF